MEHSLDLTNTNAADQQTRGNCQRAQNNQTELRGLCSGNGVNWLESESSCNRELHNHSYNTDKANHSNRNGDDHDHDDADDDEDDEDQFSASSTINESTILNNNPMAPKEGVKVTRTNDERLQFRIDWRELTYYRRPKSRLSDLFCQLDFSGGKQRPEGTNEAADHQEEPRLDKGKRILNSLDGCFKSGQLSAILGPSGAGKSTFLSTLFGNKQDEAYGRTKVTWFSSENPHQAVVGKQRSLRIASLPQHDHLLHHLTVYETLLFASKIKNSIGCGGGKKRLDGSFHRQNVRRVAKMLKLNDCLDTRCGKLSGGQYKRVSIGQELLSEPDVIILDEPTSGLDSLTCLTTIQTLKSIATKRPICIILTIHQPDVEVFGLFDSVYVIAQGGLAIYEGAPTQIMPTLARAGLVPPTATYNPARYIVELAFLIEPAESQTGLDGNSQPIRLDPGSSTSDSDSESDSRDLGVEVDDDKDKSSQSYLRRSVISLTDAISGKEMSSRLKRPVNKDKKPLLNIGIQTLDGKLITSEQLNYMRDNGKQVMDKRQAERLNLLQSLNRIQKEPYEREHKLSVNSSSSFIKATERQFVPSPSSQHSIDAKSSGKSDYSSSGWSDHRKTLDGCDSGKSNRVGKALSLANIPDDSNSSPLSDERSDKQQINRSLQMVSGCSTTTAANSDHESMSSLAASNHAEQCVVSFGNDTNQQVSGTGGAGNGPAKERRLSVRLRAWRNSSRLRQFDKSLSAKHRCSEKGNYPILYHSYLLTHRTWLSIIRDPIFFGIQAGMHTTIPILFAIIFGSHQDEGCPRVGDFDMVDFAYGDSVNLINTSVTSIRNSIANIGIVFFQMFVLGFSINCITALVFPLDMFVLVKEYRNEWYSMRSYFVGRTLADLPVPVVLHSLAIIILCYLTGQPLSCWRFGSLIVLVILSSLTAQSVGLTIGAILMKSSQSAVLAAAAAIAPFFALSGFIARVHTLSRGAQISAQFSYLHQLLNGFIILRYGFGRCECHPEDFEPNTEHVVPKNLHSLASIWIGTFANDYAQNDTLIGSNSTQQHSIGDRTNVDPNIDIVDKMITAFKMVNSYGHEIRTCDDAIPYAMLDFNLRDQDLYWCYAMLALMLVVSRLITFTAIYYKIRSVT